MKTIHQAFWNWADKYYNQNVDTIDIEALYDRTLTVEENITLFKENFPQIATNTTTKYATQTPTQTTIANNRVINLDKIKSLAILGDTGTAKTNLMFYLGEQYKGTRKKYLLGYPKDKKGYGRVSNIQDLTMLREAIVFIDEIHRYIKVYDRRANTEFMELLSIAEHNRITVVITTQLTQFITKGMDAFIDVWALTRIRDLGALKNGSKAKRIIQSTTDHRCNNWSLSLENGEYLLYSERYGAEQNGIKKFPNMGVQKDWGGLQ